MIKIAACIIVKDDAELDALNRAVGSIAKYFDGIFVTANGKEVKKIKEYCEKLGIHYSYFKWTNSFADARNFNFDQANKHDNYDFIFWMDSDDILVGGDKIREIATNAKINHLDSVHFTYWYACSFDEKGVLKEIQLEHMRERMFRPGTILWKARLHETPVPIKGYELKYSKYPYDAKERPVAVMHTQGVNGSKEKMYRNKELLELELEDEKKSGEADPRTLLYLMKIYQEIGTKDLCEKTITMGEEYIAKSGWKMERGVCYEQMGLAYGKMGKELEANKCFHSAIEEYPLQVLFYIRLAQSYYNMKQYVEAEHWMKIGSQLEIDNTGSDQTNMKAIKVGIAELLVNLEWNARKDVKKALAAAEMLYKENPTDANLELMNYIHDAYDLDAACANVDKLSQYLHSIDEDQKIIDTLDVLPDAITRQPFAQNLRRQFSPPHKWLQDEICYFANFGGQFFERWDAESLEKGIGGSETAVIELAKEWSKLNWKVTVYGDPGKPHVDKFGIKWLPWYYFNSRDSFNIFIQWRSWELAGKIKAKKFFVDLHDIVSNAGIDLPQIQNIDGVFFKSKAHRDLLTKLPENKAFIVGNGVRL